MKKITILDMSLVYSSESGQTATLNSSDIKSQLGLGMNSLPGNNQKDQYQRPLSEQYTSNNSQQIEVNKLLLF
jgi:hypothetical protein